MSRRIMLILDLRFCEKCEREIPLGGLWFNQPMLRRTSLVEDHLAPRCAVERYADTGT